MDQSACAVVPSVIIPSDAEAIRSHGSISYYRPACDQREGKGEKHPARGRLVYKPPAAGEETGNTSRLGAIDEQEKTDDDWVVSALYQNQVSGVI
jgi:hypothetical protein